MSPRLNALVIGLIVLALLLAGLGVAHLRGRALRERLATTEQQATYNAEATRQLDRYVTTTTTIRQKAQEAEIAVRNAPGADAPIDPDHRALLCGELERVRGSPACTDDGP